MFVSRNASSQFFCALRGNNSPIVRTLFHREILVNSNYFKPFKALQGRFFSTRCDRKSKTSTFGWLFSISFSAGVGGYYTFNKINRSDEVELSENVFVKVTENEKLNHVPEAINGTLDEWKESCTQLDESRRATSGGNLDRALEIATNIPNSKLKAVAFEHISKILIQNGKWRSAAEVIEKISDGFQRFFAVRHLCEKLVDSGKVDQALEIVNAISCDESRSDILRCISIRLAKKKEFDSAQAVAGSIFNSFLRLDALQNIAGELLVNRKLSLAQEILVTDPNWSQNIFDIKYFSEFTVETKGLGFLLEKIDIVLDEEEKSWLLQSVSQKLIANEKWDLGIEAMMAISSDYVRLFALNEAFNTLVNKEKFDGAKALHKIISDESFQLLSIDINQQIGICGSLTDNRPVKASYESCSDYSSNIGYLRTSSDDRLIRKKSFLLFLLFLHLLTI